MPADRGTIRLVFDVCARAVTNIPPNPTSAELISRHIGNSDMNHLIPQLRIDIGIRSVTRNQEPKSRTSTATLLPALINNFIREIRQSAVSPRD
jgi:hypothetical protein